MYYNSTKPITGGTSSFLVALNEIYVMSSLVTGLELNHWVNAPSLEIQYNNDF